MQIMGYKSYAEFSVHPNMAASPEVVMPFLNDLSMMIGPKAEQVLHLNSHTLHRNCQFLSF